VKELRDDRRRLKTRGERENKGVSIFHFLFSICHFPFAISHWKAFERFLAGDALFCGKWKMTNGKWKMENEIDPLVPANLDLIPRLSQSTTQSR
jgi:hypothetical protein